MTHMRCAECEKGFKISLTHDNIWTAFCCPEHAAKWQSGRTEADIIRHQFGDHKPWSPYDRCQWCHCTLKSGYHEEGCAVREIQMKTKTGS